jgi:Ser/Thr protein kinase RdoA (MazF antagonist)
MTSQPPQPIKPPTGAPPQQAASNDVGISSVLPPDATLSSQISSAQAQASQTSGTSATQAAGDGRTRDRFETYELSIVLSHYNIGTIEAIQEFPRGSRKAPKLALRTDTGLYLLKRRQPGKDSPEKVAFCHGIQLFLAEKQFPLPHLIGTRRDNNSMLQLKGQIYELFEFIKGTPYDVSLEATADSGKILALFHKLLLDFQSEFQSAQGSYHNAKFVHQCIKQMPITMEKVHPRFQQEKVRLQGLYEFVERSYTDAGQKVNDLGLPDWPQQIVHSDWHPGNMLYRGSRVVAVIDYDTCRFMPRIIDIANGALQFSMISGGEDVSKWPDYIDESRFKRFLRAYDAVPDCVLTRAELRAVPWLMIEALIAESAIPIANTGHFARMDGVEFLGMLERKIKWIQARADSLSKVLEG